MLEGSILIDNKFTPMSYIKHQAKLLHLNSENITIASEHITTISEILEDVKLSQTDVAGEDGDAYTQSQMIQRVDSFIQTHLGASVICFTDGGWTWQFFSSPSSAEITAGEIISTLTDSIEAELTAIALALEQATSYYQFTSLKKDCEHLIILTDCRNALRCVMRRCDNSDFHQVLSRISSDLKILIGMKVYMSVA